VIINPLLEPEHADLVYDWEGCLSVPDFKGLVPRYPKVRLRGVDARGEPLDLTLDGRQARLVQHAYDHLNGVVFLDRMRDLKSLSFSEEWRLYLADASDKP
jgi:peptide deformylase